jgi:hypothetical protein
MASSKTWAIASVYATQRGLALHSVLAGDGKDGDVYLTTELTAAKVHHLPDSYRRELMAYVRLGSLGITELGRFNIPSLEDFDDDKLVIEMSYVSVPFIVDFASVYLDDDPGWIFDEGNTLEDLVRERFGDRCDEVMTLHYDLIRVAGIYYFDLNANNIKF